MGGRLELDEVVTGLMKLRGPVSKTAPRKNVNCCASTFHCVTSHVISGHNVPATVEALREVSASQLFQSQGLDRHQVAGAPFDPEGTRG